MWIAACVEFFSDLFLALAHRFDVESNEVFRAGDFGWISARAELDVVARSAETRCSPCEHFGISQHLVALSFRFAMCNFLPTVESKADWKSI